MSVVIKVSGYEYFCSSNIMRSPLYLLVKSGSKIYAETISLLTRSVICFIESGDRGLSSNSLIFYSISVCKFIFY
jgi:hypothetical protein